MCDQNLGILKEISQGLRKFIDRIADRTWEGVVMVDSDFRILLANPVIVREFAPRDSEGKPHKLAGKDYFKIMFNIDRAEKEKIVKIPVYEAITQGKVDQRDFYPTIKAANNIAYQIETYVAEISSNGSDDSKKVKLVALEFWGRMGNPEIFEDDKSYIEL